MRKIMNHNISQKDRIVCESIPNKLRLSYRAADNKKSIFLFDIDFSYSIFQYFHDRGRRDGNNALSMTISQLYCFREYHNKKLVKTLERIPAMVDYVLMETAWDKQAVKTYRADRTYSYEYDYDRAA